MTSELKPCPFCGGKAVRMSFMDMVQAPHIKATRFIGCKNCAVVSFTDVTAEEVVEAWNTRAEQKKTCRNVYDEDAPGNCFNGFTCSECDETVEDYEGYKIYGIWNYCPNCSAEVVSE